MNTQVSITEKVKTFEDACLVLGLDPENLPLVEHLPEKDRKSIVAFYKLTIITRALNEGWEPDFSDCKQLKYWNWVYVKSGANAGFAFVYSTYAPSTTTRADTGSRLCFKSEKLAMFAGKKFRDIYFEYLFIDMPKNYGK
jgi:hypothetical protein